MAKEKLSHTDVSEKSKAPQAEASHWAFHASATTEIVTTISTVTASATGIQIGFYLYRFIFSGVNINWGVLQSEFFALFHKFNYWDSCKGVMGGSDIAITDMTTFALSNKTHGLKNKLGAIQSRVSALANNI